MEYDADYQNEQGHSPRFMRHLNQTVDLVKSLVTSPNRIIEVGCGKGSFLSLLREEGYSVAGYDPAYEGDDPNIHKQYFSKTVNINPADLIILRHTLEHISNPLDFLRNIKEANSNQGKILIEVPRLEWIAQKKAFWDIFHEHCNYFSENSLSLLFTESTIKPCFGKQYMWLIADMANLVDTVEINDTIHFYDDTLFPGEVKRLKEFISSRPGCII